MKSLTNILFLSVLRVAVMVVHTCPVLALAQLQPAPQVPIGPKRQVMVSPFTIRTGLERNSPALSFSAGSTALGGSSGLGGYSTAAGLMIENPAEFGAGLADIMVTVLTGSNAFIVFDASSTSGSDESAPKRLPQFIVKGSLIEFSCRQRSGGGGVFGIGGKHGQFEHKVVFEIRLVEPLSDVVVEALTVTGKKTSKSSSVGVMSHGQLLLNYEDFQDSPLADAARLALGDAVKKLMEKANKQPWEARVIDVVQEDSGPEIYLDVSGDCGLKVGQRLEVLRPGKELIDPQSNRSIGRSRPTSLGFAEVLSLLGVAVTLKPLDSLKDDPRLKDPGLVVRLKQS
jgi:curli biogenesis system outer membrane secretion channel CsgG